MKEKRRNPRQHLVGTTLDISGGVKVFSNCNITDVSAGGMCIDNLPEKFLPSVGKGNHRFIGIVNFGMGSVRVEITPKWFRPGSTLNKMMTGFEIVGNIPKWFEFIRTHTNIKEFTMILDNRTEDLWGNYGLKHFR